MITQYSNIKQIKDSLNAIEGHRYRDTDRNVFLRNQQQFIFDNGYTDNEFHVYSGDEWITGRYNSVNLSLFAGQKFNENNNPLFLNNAHTLDIYQQFSDLQLTSGNYRFAVNFFENKIGSYDSPSFVIDKISADKKEIRLRLLDESNGQHLQEISNWINNVNQTVFNTQTSKNYLLNFGKNQTIQFVNSVVIGKYLFVKTYKPVDTDIFKENFKCWVVCETQLPYIDNVALSEQETQIQYNVLNQTNWDAYDETLQSSETSLKNWNQLLGSSLQTSQQIINSYFSGSLSGINLNIDYSDFNNFIFYSSATERLANFKYKLELLEYYTAQSSSAASLSGGTSTTNANDYKSLYNNLIGTFDEFENFLYYQSSSALFSNDIPSINPNVSFITGSYINPVPKTNNSIPYQLQSVTSSIFESWYSGTYESASLYDLRNNNKLTKSVPEFILLDENNEQLSIFVNMLGHHYDILYSYINSMTKINNRDEHPKKGMPNELLYSVAKQFGWTLTNGNQYQNLWEYVLGTNETGTPLTGSNTVGDESLPGREMTFNVWRRIVNNIPGLLKSKGTKRSIQALLSCYGVPQSLITIKEYGGPRIERKPVYEKLNFDYALDLINNNAGTVRVDYDQPINSVELRFKVDNVLNNPTVPSSMNLYSIGSNNVTINFVRGTLGTLSINGTATNEIECYNGEFLNTLLRSGSSGTLELIVQKSKYGKIVAAVSSSVTASFANTGTLTLGGATRLKGQLQELRLWSSSLQDAPFSNHTKAPGSYDGNNNAYDELIFRVPLNEKINHSVTSSLTGIEPNISNISASFIGWSSNTPYDSLEETYYYDGISIGAGTYDDNKIRIESNELTGNLSVDTRASLSQYDKAPLDSNKLGIFYSPQTTIDEDIIAQLGSVKLDQYIGDPEDQQKKSYPELIQFSRSYWKKYNNKNNLNAFINMFTLFDLSFFKQIDQLLPARVDKIKGLIVQPNLLERSKDAVFNKPVEIKNNSYTSSLNVSPELPTLYDNIDAILNNKDVLLTGISSKIQGEMRPIDMYTGSISPLSTNINISAGISVATVGQRRHRFEGCKLTGPGINIPTNSFPDGAPVVTRVTVNPNELVSSVNSEKGVFSTDRDKEITIKEEPEIIVSENDPTEIVNKSNSVSNSSLLKKGNTENQIQSPPVIKQTTTKSSNYKSNRRN
jgi:hypothetical protein